MFTFGSSFYSVWEMPGPEVWSVRGTKLLRVVIDVLFSACMQHMYCSTLRIYSMCSIQWTLIYPDFTYPAAWIIRTPNFPGIAICTFIFLA